MTRPTDIRSACPHASASFLRLNPQINNSTTAKTTPVKSKTTTTAPHDPHDVTGSNHASKPILRQSKRPKMNETESAFSAWIRSRSIACEIYEQDVTFSLANGLRYTPDVAWWKSGLRMRCYDVKGKMRKDGRWFTDDARAKIKMAASKFRAVRFFVAHPTAGGWDVQEVLP